jgi:hypothetical protein
LAQKVVDERVNIQKANEDAYKKQDDYSKQLLEQSNQKISQKRFKDWESLAQPLHFKDYQYWGGTKSVLSNDYLLHTDKWQEKVDSFLKVEKELGFDKNINFYEDACKLFPTIDIYLPDEYEIVKVELNKCIV